MHALNSDNCPMGTKGVKVYIPETEIEAYKSQREKEKNRAYLVSFIGSNDVGIVYRTKTVYIPGDGELTLDEYIKYISPMEEKEVSNPVTLNIIKFGGLYE